MPRLPDRWENYSNIGGVIEGTKFITFKVPLNENLCSHYPENMWFTPATLLEQTCTNNTPLGLIIDLTNTSRYYRPEQFTRNGVQYAKIFVPGHIIPSKEIVHRFYETVDAFLENPDNEGKLIGVHCTHGVNRTGYIVCRYMVEKLGTKPEDAIKAYGEARGYPIERENYLKDLKKRRLGGENDPESDTGEENGPDTIPGPSDRHYQGNCDNRSDQNNHRHSYHSNNPHHIPPRDVGRNGYHDNSGGYYGNNHNQFNGNIRGNHDNSYGNNRDRGNYHGHRENNHGNRGNYHGNRENYHGNRNGSYGNHGDSYENRNNSYGNRGRNNWKVGGSYGNRGQGHSNGYNDFSRSGGWSERNSDNQTGASGYSRDYHSRGGRDGYQSRRGSGGWGNGTNDSADSYGQFGRNHKREERKSESSNSIGKD